jgi:hypothetical protein
LPIAQGSETGFLNKIGREDARIIAETRFLGCFADRAETQKPGRSRSQGLPGNAYPEALPRLNPLTNPPFSPLLQPHDRQNIRVILK